MRENRLIAVDLDGTLFHTNHQLSEHTVQTMHNVVHAGHTIVVVTGRSAHSAIPKLTSMPQGIHMICSNGAYEFDRQKLQITRSNTISTRATLDIRTRILAQLPSASFGWESKNGLGYEPQFEKEAGGAHTLEQGGTHDIVSHVDTLKIFVRTPELKHAALALAIQETLKNEFEVSSSGVPFVEITASGVNKGSALSQLATDLGFSADQTTSFGDNQNDIPMFKWAGEAVAMGNAIPELTSIATAQTLSNAEDGVAHYINHHLLGS